MAIPGRYDTKYSSNEDISVDKFISARKLLFYIILSLHAIKRSFKITIYTAEIHLTCSHIPQRIFITDKG
jgi:hypothetical protein